MVVRFACLLLRSERLIKIETRILSIACSMYCIPHSFKEASIRSSNGVFMYERIMVVLMRPLKIAAELSLYTKPLVCSQGRGPEEQVNKELCF